MTSWFLWVNHHAKRCSKTRKYLFEKLSFVKTYTMNRNSLENRWYVGSIHLPQPANTKSISNGNQSIGLEFHAIILYYLLQYQYNISSHHKHQNSHVLNLNVVCCCRTLSFESRWRPQNQKIRSNQAQTLPSYESNGHITVILYSIVIIINSDIHWMERWIIP